MKIKALFLTLSLLGACSSTEILNSENPELIYNESVRLIDKDYYLDAKEHLDELRRRFPQSRFAVLAELRAADLEYTQDNFTEAAVAYGTFVELYPNHAEAPYAQFRRVESYYKDTPSNIARDQAPAKDAAAAAQQMLRRYPNTQYSAETQKYYEKSRLRLAEKEAYIARFYERKDKPSAAYHRWLNLIQNFKDLRSAEDPKAAKLLAHAEARIKDLHPKLAESEKAGES